MGGIGDWNAFFHADDQSLTSVPQLVTDVVVTDREAWLDAVINDPLPACAAHADRLPGRILPSDYLGQQAWRRRVEVLRAANRQLRTFKPE